MHPSTFIRWRVTLPTRQAAVELLARIAQLPIRPLAGADVGGGQTTLFFKDDINSAPLLLLLRPLTGQQVPADAITCGVWAEPQLLRRALETRQPEPHPTGQLLAEPAEAEPWSERWGTMPSGAAGALPTPG